MARITLEYDGRNKIIKQLLDVIICLGAIERKNENLFNTDTIEAIDDARKQKVVKFSSFDSFKKKMYEI